MMRVEYGILLCAGLGVRLQPLTEVRPKPLIRFLDVPIAAYAFRAMERAGVTMIGANGFHHADQLAPFLAEMSAGPGGEGSIPVRTALIVENELRGTGGGARGVWEALGRPHTPVVVANGDVVADFPIEQMLKVHRRTGAAATMMVIPPVPGEGSVFLDESRLFVAQLPGLSAPHRSPAHAPAHGVTFGGLYVLSPEVLARVPATGNACLIRQGVAPLLADGAMVAAFEYEGAWADLGTPSRFLSATWDVLRRPETLPHGPVRSRSDLVFAPDVRTIHPTARIVGPAYVAEGAEVGAGAVVGPLAVVGGGCRVADGCEVSESVLMDGAVAEGNVVRRILLGDRSAKAG